MQMRKAAAIACSILSIAARICGILLCLLTVLLCFPGIAARLNIASFVIDLTTSLPSIISGYGLIPSPFGGVFRFDFAICAFVLFVLDYALQRASYGIR